MQMGRRTRRLGLQDECRAPILAGTGTVEDCRRVGVTPGMDEAHVEDLREHLAEQSMLLVEHGASGRPFRLLETVRGFGAGQLAESGSTGHAVARHWQWCLAELGASTTSWSVRPSSSGWLGSASSGRTCGRPSVDRPCRAGDHLLAYALVRPVAAEVTLRRQAEIGDWAERILAIPTESDTDRLVFWLTWATHRLHAGVTEKASRGSSVDVVTTSTPCSGTPAPTCTRTTRHWPPTPECVNPTWPRGGAVKWPHSWRHSSA